MSEFWDMVNQKIDEGLEKILSLNKTPVENLPKYFLTKQFLKDNWYVLGPEDLEGTYTNNIYFAYDLYKDPRACLKAIEFERINRLKTYGGDKQSKYLQYIKEGKIAVIYDKSQIIFPNEIDKWEQYLFSRAQKGLLSDYEQIEWLKTMQRFNKTKKILMEIKSAIDTKLSTGIYSLTENEKKQMTEYLQEIESRENPVQLDPVEISEGEKTPMLEPNNPNVKFVQNVQKVIPSENENAKLDTDTLNAFAKDKKVYTLSEYLKPLNSVKEEEIFKSNNQDLIDRYKELGTTYLLSTEKIGKSLGYDIVYTDVLNPNTKEPCGLIFANVMDTITKQTVFKDFTIDLCGNLFDNRVKFFPFIINIPYEVNTSYYEDYQAYSFNRIGKEFTYEEDSYIRDYLMCGLYGLPEKGYYSLEEIRLHNVVDTRSLKNIQVQERNELVKTLIRANGITTRNEKGVNVFEYALSLSPYSRFSLKTITSYSDGSHKYNFTNENIEPRMFLQPDPNSTKLRIEIHKNNVEVIS